MPRKYIRCGHWFLNDPRTYFFWSIPDTSTLDFTHLTALCRGSEEQPVGNETECIFFFDSVNVSTKPTVHCEWFKAGTVDVACEEGNCARSNVWDK